MRARDTDGATRWKIVDFGLALDALPSGSGTVGGTAAYVAPEQALGERVDPRADLYSASLVLYRALTGRPAFVGQDPREVATRARQDRPPDPKAFVRLPDELVLELRLGRATDPKDRFATAREAGKAFSAAFDGEISAAHRARAEALLARAPGREAHHLRRPRSAGRRPRSTAAAAPPALPRGSRTGRLAVHERCSTTDS
jgi:serine/threonine-protein kinase